MQELCKGVILPFFLFILLSSFVSAGIFCDWFGWCDPEPTGMITINDLGSNLVLTKYIGEEKEKFIPSINGNQLCIYHKAGTDAQTIEELRQLINETKSNVSDWANDSFGNVGSDSVTINVAYQNTTSTTTTCRYKKFGYYDKTLPFMVEDNCI